MLAEHALDEAEMLEDHLEHADEKHHSDIKGFMKDALDRHDGYHKRMKDHKVEPTCEIGKMYKHMLHDDHMERRAKLKQSLES